MFKWLGLCIFGNSASFDKLLSNVKLIGVGIVNLVSVAEDKIRQENSVSKIALILVHRVFKWLGLCYFGNSASFDKLLSNVKLVGVGIVNLV